MPFAIADLFVVVLIGVLGLLFFRRLAKSKKFQGLVTEVEDDVLGTGESDSDVVESLERAGEQADARIAAIEAETTQRMSTAEILRRTRQHNKK
jgi:hypothetical protein